MPHVVSDAWRRPFECSSSSELIRPPIEVPTANAWVGLCGSSASTADSVWNWSLSALSSAHHEPFGSYEDPARAYPRASSAAWVLGSGASCATGGPKPWL